MSQFNLAEINELIVENFDDRLAIVFRDRRFTYADFGQRSRQFARVLRDRGVGIRLDDRTIRNLHESHQDHVAIYATNGNEYLEAMLGAFKARAVPMNINFQRR